MDSQSQCRRLGRGGALVQANFCYWSEWPQDRSALRRASGGLGRSSPWWPTESAHLESQARTPSPSPTCWGSNSIGRSGPVLDGKMAEGRMGCRRGFRRQCISRVTKDAHVSAPKSPSERQALRRIKCSFTGTPSELRGPGARVPRWPLPSVCSGCSCAATGSHAFPTSPSPCWVLRSRRRLQERSARWLARERGQAPTSVLRGQSPRSFRASFSSRVGSLDELSVGRETECAPRDELRMNAGGVSLIGRRWPRSGRGFPCCREHVSCAAVVDH